MVCDSGALTDWLTGAAPRYIWVGAWRLTFSPSDILGFIHHSIMIFVGVFLLQPVVCGSFLPKA